MAESPCILPLTRKQLLRDIAFAVTLAVLSCLHVVLIPLLLESGRLSFGDRLEHVGAIPQAGPLAIALVLVAFLPLAARRLRPLTVLGVTVAAASAFRLLLPDSPSTADLAPLIALYTVGTLYPRRTLLEAASGAAIVRFIAAAVGAAPDRWLSVLVESVAITAVAASVGDATRSRRAYIAEVEQRAFEAERSREEEALRRVEEERLRIARELHDVTGHALSIIAVQAGGAQRVVDRDPDAAKQALEAIRTTSRGALDELRSIVGVLRNTDEDAPLAPVGRLSRLAELIASVEAAGIATRIDIEGTVTDLPVFVDLSAYRIVQEALTNVVRHAQARNVTVSLERYEDSLSIEICDDGRGSGDPSTPPGHGLIGMRERVAALRGSFEAGARPEGGYRVAATLPLGTES